MIGLRNRNPKVETLSTLISVSNFAFASALPAIQIYFRRSYLRAGAD